MNYAKGKRKRYKGGGNTTGKFPAVRQNRKRIIEGRPMMGNQREQE